MKKTLSALLCALLLAEPALSNAATASVWSDRRVPRSTPSNSNSPALFAALPVLPAPGQRLSFRPEIAEPTPAVPVLAHSETALSRLLAHAPLDRVVLGEVRDSGDAPPVIIFRDVHLNPEAQKNAAAAIDALGNAGVASVGVEGAFDALPVGLLAKFPHKDALRRVADDFLDAGLLAAPSYAAITHVGNGLPEFVGIDDHAHYDANVRAYIGGRAAQPAAKAALQSARAAAIALADRELSAPLKKFLHAKLAQDGGGNDFGGYVEMLAAESTDQTPVVRRFLEARRIEKRLDFDRIERERRRAIENLTAKLSAGEINRLVSSALAFRNGQTGQGAFYAGLRALFERAGIRLESTPAFDEYLRYVALADGIRAEELLEQIAALEKQSLQRLAGNDRSKRIFDLVVCLGAVGRLMEFSLTPEEWDAHRRGWPLAVSAAGEFGVPLTGLDRLEPFEAFYREAEARTETMLQRLMAGNKGARLVVVGGFHAPRLAALLRARGVPYAMLSPRLTHVDGTQGSAYLSVFEREKTPLERMFRGERLSINPETVNISDRWLVFRLVTSALFSATGINQFVLRRGASPLSVELIPGKRPSENLIRIVHNPIAELRYFAPAMLASLISAAAIGFWPAALILSAGAIVSSVFFARAHPDKRVRLFLVGLMLSAPFAIPGVGVGWGILLSASGHLVYNAGVIAGRSPRAPPLIQRIANWLPVASVPEPIVLTPALEHMIAQTEKDATWRPVNAPGFLARMRLRLSPRVSLTRDFPSIAVRDGTIVPVAGVADDGRVVEAPGKSLKALPSLAARLEREGITLLVGEALLKQGFLDEIESAAQDPSIDFRRFLLARSVYPVALPADFSKRFDGLSGDDRSLLFDVARRRVDQLFAETRPAPDESVVRSFVLLVADYLLKANGRVTPNLDAASDHSMGMRSIAGHYSYDKRSPYEVFAALAAISVATDRVVAAGGTRDAALRPFFDSLSFWVNAQEPVASIYLMDRIVRFWDAMGMETGADVYFQNAFSILKYSLSGRDRDDPRGNVAQSLSEVDRSMREGRNWRSFLRLFNGLAVRFRVDGVELKLRSINRLSGLVSSGEFAGKNNVFKAEFMAPDGTIVSRLFKRVAREAVEHDAIATSVAAQVIGLPSYRVWDLGTAGDRDDGDVWEMIEMRPSTGLVDDKTIPTRDRATEFVTGDPELVRQRLETMGGIFALEYLGARDAKMKHVLVDRNTGMPFRIDWEYMFFDDGAVPAYARGISVPDIPHVLAGNEMDFVEFVADRPGGDVLLAHIMRGFDSAYERMRSDIATDESSSVFRIVAEKTLVTGRASPVKAYIRGRFQHDGGAWRSASDVREVLGLTPDRLQRRIAKTRGDSEPPPGSADIVIASDGMGLFDGPDHDAFHQRGGFERAIREIAAELGLAVDAPEIDFRTIVAERGGRVETSRGLIRIEDDGVLTMIDDRFNADHAGRGRWAVYARSEARANHELTELRAWANWATSTPATAAGAKPVTADAPTIASIDDVHEGRLGARIRAWLSGRDSPDVSYQEVGARRALAKKKADEFHRAGLAAEGVDFSLGSRVIAWIGSLPLPVVNVDKEYRGVIEGIGVDTKRRSVTVFAAENPNDRGAFAPYSMRNAVYTMELIRAALRRYGRDAVVDAYLGGSTAAGAAGAASDVDGSILINPRLEGSRDELFDLAHVLTGVTGVSGGHLAFPSNEKSFYRWTNFSTNEFPYAWIDVAMGYLHWLEAHPGITAGDRAMLSEYIRLLEADGVLQLGHGPNAHRPASVAATLPETAGMPEVLARLRGAGATQKVDTLRRLANLLRDEPGSGSQLTEADTALVANSVDTGKSDVDRAAVTAFEAISNNPDSRPTIPATMAAEIGSLWAEAPTPARVAYRMFSAFYRAAPEAVGWDELTGILENFSFGYLLHAGEDASSWERELWALVRLLPEAPEQIGRLQRNATPAVVAHLLQLTSNPVRPVRLAAYALLDFAIADPTVRASITGDQVVRLVHGLTTRNDRGEISIALPVVLRPFLRGAGRSEGINRLIEQAADFSPIAPLEHDLGPSTEQRLEILAAFIDRVQTIDLTSTSPADRRERRALLNFTRQLSERIGLRDGAVLADAFEGFYAALTASANGRVADVPAAVAVVNQRLDALAGRARHHRLEPRGNFYEFRAPEEGPAALSSKQGLGFALVWGGILLVISGALNALGVGDASLVWGIGAAAGFIGARALILGAAELVLDGFLRDGRRLGARYTTDSDGTIRLDFGQDPHAGAIRRALYYPVAVPLLALVAPLGFVHENLHRFVRSEGVVYGLEFALIAVAVALPLSPFAIAAPIVGVLVAGALHRPLKAFFRKISDGWDSMTRRSDRTRIDENSSDAEVLARDLAQAWQQRQNDSAAGRISNLLERPEPFVGRRRTWMGNPERVLDNLADAQFPALLKRAALSAGSPVDAVALESALVSESVRDLPKSPVVDLLSGLASDRPLVFVVSAAHATADLTRVAAALASGSARRRDVMIAAESGVNLSEISRLAPSARIATFTPADGVLADRLVSLSALSTVAVRSGLSAGLRNAAIILGDTLLADTRGLARTDLETLTILYIDQLLQGVEIQGVLMRKMEDVSATLLVQMQA